MAPRSRRALGGKPVSPLGRRCAAVRAPATRGDAPMAVAPGLAAAHLAIALALRALAHPPEAAARSLPYAPPRARQRASRCMNWT